MSKIESKMTRNSFATWILMVATVVVMVACDTTNPKQFDGSANLTINLSVADEGTIIADELILSHHQKSLIYRGVLQDNSVTFTDIELGSYSLLFGPYAQITIYNNVVVDEDSVIYTIEFDSHSFDHRVITIQNDTNEEIQKIHITFDIFLNHGLWGHVINVMLLKSSGYNIIIPVYDDQVPTISIRLYGADKTYTKSSIVVHQNLTVSFTEKDMYQEGLIGSHHDFIEWSGFETRIWILENSINLDSKIPFHEGEYALDGEYMSLQINGITVDFDFIGYVSGAVSGSYRWEGNYDFYSETSYHLILKSNHPIHSFEESLYLQKMNVNWHESIDCEQVTLRWEWHPQNDEQINSIRLQISNWQDISSSPINLIDEMMPPFVSEFSIPTSLIPIIVEGTTKVSFDYSYAISGRVALYRARVVSTEYVNSVLQTKTEKKNK